eukprot:14179998-Alexandrium_andersonii.AAC.1
MRAAEFQRSPGSFGNVWRVRESSGESWGALESSGGLWRVSEGSGEVWTIMRVLLRATEYYSVLPRTIRAI